MFRVVVIAAVFLVGCAPKGAQRELAAVPAIETVVSPVAKIARACAAQIHSIHANSAGDRLLVTCQEMLEPDGATHVTEWLYEIPGGKLLESVQDDDGDIAVVGKEIALFQRFEPWANGASLSECADRRWRALCRFRAGIMVRRGAVEELHPGSREEVARLVDPEHALLAIATFAGPCRRELLSWNARDRTVHRKMLSNCDYDAPVKIIRTANGELNLERVGAAMAPPPYDDMAIALPVAGGATTADLSRSWIKRTAARQSDLNWNRPQSTAIAPYYWNGALHRSVDDWSRTYGFLPEAPNGFRILVGAPLDLGPQYLTAYGPVYLSRDSAGVSDRNARFERYWIFSNDGRLALAQGRGVKVMPLASRRPLIAVVGDSQALEVYDLAAIATHRNRASISPGS